MKQTCVACQKEFSKRDLMCVQDSWCIECGNGAPLDLTHPNVSYYRPDGSINMKACMHNRPPMHMAPELWTDQEREDYFVTRRS